MNLLIKLGPERFVDVVDPDWGLIGGVVLQRTSDDVRDRESGEIPRVADRNANAVIYILCRFRIDRREISL